MASMRDRMKRQREDRKAATGGGTKYRLPDNTEFYTAPKGNVVLDFIPYTLSTPSKYGEIGDSWWQKTIFVHYAIGTDQKSYICPRTISKRCPICDYRDKLRKEDAENNAELIAALKPKERELYNVVDASKDGGQPDAKILLWDFSYFLFGKKLREELDESPEEYQDFVELVDGYSVKIRFADKAFGGNSFVDAQRIDFVKRKYNYDKSIQQRALDLDTIIVVLPYEDLERLFLQNMVNTGEYETGGPEPPLNSVPPSTRTEAVATDAGDAPPFEADPPKQAPERTESRPTTVATEKTATTASKPSTKPGGVGSKPCPGGGTFGEDTDSTDECGADKCPHYAECEALYLNQ